MIETVRELNRHFIELWRESAAGEAYLPDLGPGYTPGDQSRNEAHLLQFLSQVDQLLSHPPRGREEAHAAQGRLGGAFRSLAEEAVGFTAAQLEGLPSQAFSEASEEFVRRARAFDRGLSGEDIYQAGRNAWTAHGLQWLLHMPVQLTPSILGYSLLYPYTDNFLDDPEIPPAAKLAFNERFHRRLAGETPAPADAQERTIFDLVSMIEGQYPRSENPAVFDSLLEIHQAQSRSLKLMRGASAPDAVDVIGLSFHKGGTSVLVDGYLVSSSLDPAQRQYTYGHGIFAQLLDDMEDVRQDRLAGRLTLYSRPEDHKPLDALANRTFHFGRRILLGLDCFDVEESSRDLIRRGADLFLIDAISRTDEYYSQSYLRELEVQSPFRFSFLKAQRDRFFKRYGSQGKWMETLLAFSSV